MAAMHSDVHASGEPQVTIMDAIRNVNVLDEFMLVDDVPCIEAAALSIHHHTNYDTNFEDRNAYVVGLARYIEEATRHAQMNELLREGQEYAVMLYTWRSCSRALPQIRSNEQHNRIDIYERTVEVLQPYANQLMNFMFFQVKAIQAFCSDIKRLLSMNQKSKGDSVSEAYLLTMGKMLNMFAVLDELKNMKASMKNDYSHYKRAAQFLRHMSDPSALQDAQNLTMFLATQNKIRDSLKEELLKVNGFEDLFCDVVNTCAFMFDNKLYLLPSEKHLLVKVIGFALYLIDTNCLDVDGREKIISINKLDAKRKLNLAKIDSIFKQCEVVNLYGDMSIAPFTYVSKSPNFDSGKWPECTNNRISSQGAILHQLPALREEHTKLLGEVAKHTNMVTTVPRESQRTDAENKELSDLALSALRALNKWNLLVLDMFTWKLANLSDPRVNRDMPPDAEDYAKAVQYNYSHEEKSALVELIAMIKSVQALLLRIETIFSDAIKRTVYSELQSFVQKHLREPLRKAVKNKRDVIRSIILAIRATCADRMPAAEGIEEEDPALKGKKDREGATYEVRIPRRNVGPSSTQLYMVRTMLESLIDRSGGKHTLRNQLDIESLRAIDQFHKQSFFWSYLLNFNDTLHQCCDLSQLWYREFYLEMTNGQRIQFDIDMSLPWILTKHILESRDPRVSEYLLYPLDLYNDSAFYALTHFKRQFLYDEIEAEVNLGFDQLVYRLSDQMFSYYKQVAASVLLDKRFRGEYGSAMNRVVAYPPPNRYNVLIRQRHITLLGRSIDLNRLLAQRMNKAILNSINAAIRRFECNNITAIIELEALIDCNRLCHRLLCNAGLDLDEFDSLLSEANNDVTVPYGRVTMHIFWELNSDFIPNYCYNGGTNRFVPTKHPMSSEAVERPAEPKDVLPQMMWGTQRMNDCYKAVFTLYSKFVGAPHFAAMTRLLGYAGIAIVIRELLKIVKGLLEGTLCNYVKDLLKHMPKICKMHRMDYGSPGMLAFYFSQLKGIIQYPELRTEVFHTFREVGNIILVCHLMEQHLTIEEVTDLKHAAPFQDILPKPFIPPPKDKNKSAHDLRREREEQTKAVMKKLEAKYAALQVANVVLKLGGPEGEIIEKQSQVVQDCDLLTRERLCCGLCMFDTVLNHVRLNLGNDPIWQGQEPANGVLSVDECTEFHRLWSAMQFAYCVPPSENNFTVEELFGEGLQWAGCTLITLLGQERRFEALDMSYHLLKMNKIDQKEDTAQGVSLKRMVDRIRKFQILNLQIFATLNKYLKAGGSDALPVEHVTCFDSPKHENFSRYQ